MPLSHNEIVASRFAKHAHDYENHAGLQAEIAEQLASMLPDMERPSVLEVGCGTGLLTKRLLARYPDGRFLFTDLAREMIDECRSRHASKNGRAVRFAVMDGENPECSETFDLIVMSMTLQWFTDPVSGLRKLAGMLRPGGKLFYATLAPDCLPEWRDALRSSGISEGLMAMPVLPGVCEKEARSVDYGSGIAFLERVKSIGAGTPRPDYRPVPPGALRRALRRLEKDSHARVTWRIVYGCIASANAVVT